LFSNRANGSEVGRPANAQFKNVVYYNGNGPNSDGWIPMGFFWLMQLLLLGNSYIIVEGLVASAENGDIGL
jgi:hypothetical protein